MFWKHKEKAKPIWQLFFAWKPTPVGEYPLEEGQKVIWLQWMERRWLDSRECVNRYEYREVAEKL